MIYLGQELSSFFNLYLSSYVTGTPMLNSQDICRPTAAVAGGKEAVSLPEHLSCPG